MLFQDTSLVPELAPIPARAPFLLGSILAPIAVALVACILYCLVLPGGFPFDDRMLEDHPPVGVKRVLYDGYWEYPSVDRDYRPLTFLSVDWNHSQWREAAGFHFVNLLLHAGAAVLAYYLFQELLRDRLLAGLGAALFAALPILADAVGSIL